MDEKLDKRNPPNQEVALGTMTHTLHTPEMRINKVIIKDKNGNVIEEIDNDHRDSETR